MTRTLKSRTTSGRGNLAVFNLRGEKLTVMIVDSQIRVDEDCERAIRCGLVEKDGDQVCISSPRSYPH